MKLNKLKIGIILLLLLFGCQKTGNTNTDSKQDTGEEIRNIGNIVRHDIRMFDNFIEPDTIKVEKGSLVNFFIIYFGNRTNWFSVEGYDVEERLQKGKIVSVSFRADKEGSFGFGDFKRVIGELVVE